MARDETDKKIEELQLLEGHLQNFLAQKQSMQIELNEIENALEELKNSGNEVYKMTSGFLIKSNQADVKKELEEKKRLLNVKIGAMEKQEKLIETDVARLRTEINKIIGQQK
jgi:prefoldin beta subunit